MRVGRAEFAVDRSDPPLSERVGHRSPHRGLEDLGAFGAEDLIEGVDELAPTIANTTPSTVERFRSRQVGLESGAQLGHVAGVACEDECAEALGDHGKVSVDNIAA